MLAKRIALWRPSDLAAIDSDTDIYDSIDLKGLPRYFNHISKHDLDDYNLIAEHMLRKYIDKKRERELFEPLFTKRQNLIKMRRTHGGVLRKNVTARLEENERREKKGKEQHHFIDDVMLLKQFMSKVSPDEYLKKDPRPSNKKSDSSKKEKVSQTNEPDDDVIKPEEVTENHPTSTDKDDKSDEIVYMTSRNMNKIQSNLANHNKEKKKEPVDKIGNTRSKSENNRKLVKAKLHIANFKEEFSKSKDRAMRTKVLNEIKKLLSFYYMKPDRRNQLDNTKLSDKLSEDGEIVQFLKTRVEGFKDFVSHGFPGMKNGTRNDTIDEGTILNTFYPKAMKAMFSYSHSLQGNEPDTPVGNHNLTQDLVFLDKSLKGGDDNGTVTHVHNFVRNLEYLIKSGYLSKNTDDEILTNVQTFMKYLVTFLDQNMNDTTEVLAKDNDISSGLMDDKESKKSTKTSYKQSEDQSDSSSNVKPDKSIDLDKLAQQTDEIDHLENKMAQDHAFDEKDHEKVVDDEDSKPDNARLAKLGFDELNSQSNNNDNDNSSPDLSKNKSQLKNELNYTDSETNDLVQKTERKLSPAAEKVDEELTAIYNLKNKKSQNSNNVLQHVKNQTDSLDNKWRLAPNNGVQYEYHTPIHDDDTYAQNMGNELPFFKKESKTNSFDNVVNAHKKKTFSDTKISKALNPNENYVVLRCLGFQKRPKHANNTHPVQKRSLHILEEHLVNDLMRRSPNEARVHTAMGDIWLPCHRLGNVRKLSNVSEFASKSFSNSSLSNTHSNEEIHNKDEVSHHAYHHQHMGQQSQNHPLKNYTAQVVDVILPARRLAPSNQTLVNGPDEKLDSFFNKTISPISSNKQSTTEKVKESKDTSRQTMKSVTDMLSKHESTDTSANENENQSKESVSTDEKAEKSTSNVNDNSSENEESVSDQQSQKLIEDVSPKKENLTEDLEKYVPSRDILNVTDALDNYFLSNSNNPAEEDTCENGYIRTADKKIQCRSDISNQYEALTSETETRIMNEIINNENKESKSKTSEIDAYIPSGGSKQHNQSKSFEENAEDESQNFVDMKNMTYSPDQTSDDMSPNTNKVRENDATNAGTNEAADKSAANTDTNQDTDKVSQNVGSIEEAGKDTTNSSTTESSDKDAADKKENDIEKKLKSMSVSNDNNDNTEIKEKSEKTENVEKSDKSEKTEKTEKTGENENTIKTEKTETAENKEKSEKAEKTEKTEKSDNEPKTENKIDLVNKTDPFHINTTQDNLKLYLVGVPINGSKNASVILSNLTDHLIKDNISDASQLIQSTLDKSLIIEPLKVNVIPNEKGLLKLHSNSSLDNKIENEEISTNVTNNSTMKNIAIPGKNHSSNMSIDIKVDKNLDYEPLAKLIVQQISNLFSSNNYTMSIEPNDNKTMNIISAHVIKNNSKYYVSFAGNNTNNQSLLINTTEKALQIPFPLKEKDKKDDKKKEDKNKNVVDDLTAIRHHNAFVKLYNNKHHSKARHHKRHHPHPHPHHHVGNPIKDKPRFVTVNDEENINSDNHSEELSEDQPSRDEPDENEENDDNESDEEDEEPMTDPSLYKAMNYNPNTDDENNIHHHENYHSSPANTTHSDDDYDDNDEDEDEDDDNDTDNQPDEVHADRAEVNENELLHGEDGKGVIHDDSFDGMDSDQYNRNSESNTGNTQVNEFVENQGDVLQAASRLVDAPAGTNNAVNQISQITGNNVESYQTGPQTHATNFDVNSFSTVHQTAGPQITAQTNADPIAFSEAPIPVSSHKKHHTHHQLDNQLDLKKIMANVDRNEEPLINSEINAKVGKQSENKYWTPLYMSQPGSMNHPTNITSSAMQFQPDPNQVLEQTQGTVAVKTPNIQITQLNSDSVIDKALQQIDHPQAQSTNTLIAKALQSADAALPLPSGTEENIDDSLKHLPVRKALMDNSHNQVHLYTGPSVNYYTNDLAASNKDSGLQKSFTPVSKSKYETQVLNFPDLESDNESQKEMNDEYKKLVNGINTESSSISMGSSQIYAGSGLVNVDKTADGGNRRDGNNHIVGNRRSLLDNKTTNDRLAFDFNEPTDVPLLPVNQLERRITDFNPSLTTNKVEPKKPLSSLIKEHFDKIDQSLEKILHEDKSKGVKSFADQKKLESKNIPYKISSIRGIVLDNGTSAFENAELLKKSEKEKEQKAYMNLQHAKLRVLDMAKEYEKYHDLNLKEASPSVNRRPKPDQVLVLVAEPLGKVASVEPIEMNNNKMNLLGVVRQFNLPGLNRSSEDENYIPLDDSSLKNESKNEGKTVIQNRNETTKINNEAKNETAKANVKSNSDIKDIEASTNSNIKNETSKTNDEAFALSVKNNTDKLSYDNISPNLKDDIKNVLAKADDILKANGEKESNTATSTGKVYDTLAPVKENTDIKNETATDISAKANDAAANNLLSSVNSSSISEGTVRSISFENSSHPIHDDINKYDIYLKDLADKKGVSSGKRITVNAADQEVSFQIKTKPANDSKFAYPIEDDSKGKTSRDTPAVINLSLKPKNETDIVPNSPQSGDKDKPENVTKGVTLVGYSNASTFEYDDTAIAKGAAKATYLDKTEGAKQPAKSNEFEKKVEALDFWSAEPKANLTSGLKENSTLTMPKNKTLANITDTIKDIVDSINLIPSAKNESVESNTEATAIVPANTIKDTSFGMLSKPIYDNLEEYEKANAQATNIGGSHQYEDQLDQTTDIPANFYVPHQHEQMETTPSQYINLGSDERITQSLKPFLDQQFKTPPTSTLGDNVATNENANVEPSLDEYEIVITNLTKGGDIILKKKQKIAVNTTTAQPGNHTLTYGNQTASPILNQIVNQDSNPKKPAKKKQHKKKHHIKVPKGVPKFIKVHFDEQPTYGGGYNEMYNRDDEDDGREEEGNQEEVEEDEDEPTNEFVNRNMFRDDEMERDKENEYNEEQMNHLRGNLGRENYQAFHENENEDQEGYQEEPPQADVSRYTQERYNNMPPIPQMMQKGMRLFNTSASSDSQYSPNSEVGVEIPRKVDISSETGQERYSTPSEPSDPYMNEPTEHTTDTDAALTQSYLSHVGGGHDAMVTPGVSFTTTNNYDPDTGADSVSNSNVVMNHLAAHLINLVENDNATKTELQEDINKYLGDCNGFRDKCHYIDPKGSRESSVGRKRSFDGFENHPVERDFDHHERATQRSLNDLRDDEAIYSDITQLSNDFDDKRINMLLDKISDNYRYYPETEHFQHFSPENLRGSFNQTESELDNTYDDDDNGDQIESEEEDAEAKRLVEKTLNKDNGGRDGHSVRYSGGHLYNVSRPNATYDDEPSDVFGNKYNKTVFEEEDERYGNSDRGMHNDFRSDEEENDDHFQSKRPSYGFHQDYLHKERKDTRNENISKNDLDMGESHNDIKNGSSSSKSAPDIKDSPQATVNTSINSTVTHKNESHNDKNQVEIIPQIIQPKHIAASENSTSPSNNSSNAKPSDNEVKAVHNIIQPNQIISNYASHSINDQVVTQSEKNSHNDEISNDKIKQPVVENYAQQGRKNGPHNGEEESEFVNPPQRHPFRGSYRHQENDLKNDDDYKTYSASSMKEVSIPYTGDHPSDEVTEQDNPQTLISSILKNITNPPEVELDVDVLERNASAIAHGGEVSTLKEKVQNRFNHRIEDNEISDDFDQTESPYANAMPENGGDLVHSSYENENENLSENNSENENTEEREQHINRKNNPSDMRNKNERIKSEYSPPRKNKNLSDSSSETEKYNAPVDKKNKESIESKQYENLTDIIESSNNENYNQKDESPSDSKVSNINNTNVESETHKNGTESSNLASAHQVALKEIQTLLTKQITKGTKNATNSDNKNNSTEKGSNNEKGTGTTVEELIHQLNNTLEFSSNKTSPRAENNSEPAVEKNKKMDQDSNNTDVRVDEGKNEKVEETSNNTDTNVEEEKKVNRKEDDEKQGIDIDKEQPPKSEELKEKNYDSQDKDEDSIKGQDIKTNKTSEKKEEKEEEQSIEISKEKEITIEEGKKYQDENNKKLSSDIDPSNELTENNTKEETKSLQKNEEEKDSSKTISENLEPKQISKTDSAKTEEHSSSADQNEDGKKSDSSITATESKTKENFESKRKEKESEGQGIKQDTDLHEFIKRLVAFEKSYAEANKDHDENDDDSAMHKLHHFVKKLLYLDKSMFVLENVLDKENKTLYESELSKQPKEKHFHTKIVEKVQTNSKENHKPKSKKKNLEIHFTDNSTEMMDLQNTSNHETLSKFHANVQDVVSACFANDQDGLKEESSSKRRSVSTEKDDYEELSIKVHTPRGELVISCHNNNSTNKVDSTNERKTTLSSGTTKKVYKEQSNKETSDPNKDQHKLIMKKKQELQSEMKSNSVHRINHLIRKLLFPKDKHFKSYKLVSSDHHGRKSDATVKTEIRSNYLPKLPETKYQKLLQDVANFDKTAVSWLSKNKVLQNGRSTSNNEKYLIKNRIISITDDTGTKRVLGPSSKETDTKPIKKKEKTTEKTTEKKRKCISHKNQNIKIKAYLDQKKANDKIRLTKKEILKLAFRKMLSPMGETVSRSKDIIKKLEAYPVLREIDDINHRDDNLTYGYDQNNQDYANQENQESNQGANDESDVSDYSFGDEENEEEDDEGHKSKPRDVVDEPLTNINPDTEVYNNNKFQEFNQFQNPEEEDQNTIVNHISRQTYFQQPQVPIVHQIRHRVRQKVPVFHRIHLRNYSGGDSSDSPNHYDYDTVQDRLSSLTSLPRRVHNVAYSHPQFLTQTSSVNSAYGNNHPSGFSERQFLTDVLNEDNTNVLQSHPQLHYMRGTVSSNTILSGGEPSQLLAGLLPDRPVSKALPPINLYETDDSANQISQQFETAKESNMLPQFVNQFENSAGMLMNSEMAFDYKKNRLPVYKKRHGCKHNTTLGCQSAFSKNQTTILLQKSLLCKNNGTENCQQRGLILNQTDYGNHVPLPMHRLKNST